MKKSNPILMIIWGALLSSHLLHVAVGEIASVNTEPPEMILPIILCALGLSTTMISLLVIPKVMKVNLPSQLTTVFIIQWALVEATGLFGLIARILGAEAYFQYGMVGIAFAGMLFLFPSEKVQTEMLRKGSE